MPKHANCGKRFIEGERTNQGDVEGFHFSRARKSLRAQTISGVVLASMEAPVAVPVAAGVGGAQLDHDVSAVDAPARVGDSQPTSDEILARVFDDAGRDGNVLREDCGRPLFVATIYCERECQTSRRSGRRSK